MSTKYTYSIQNDFINQKVATDRLNQEIGESTITIGLDYIATSNDDCDIWFKSALSGGEQTTLSGVVSAHSGEVLSIEEKRDASGKLRIHQTSRQLGTKTYFTGAGDDPTDVTNYGEGAAFQLHHEVGSGIQTEYIDLNVVENKTWIHEGYVTWKNCDLDSVCFEVVPRIVNYTASSGTNYNLYGGYLVIPAAGDGTINVTSDITTHSGGLIYMPDSDDGISPTAYWNADWNITTKGFENISAAPSGNGRYNMFTVEVVLARFANKIPFLVNGFLQLQTSDIDQLGQGMRFKMYNHTHGTDHEWTVAAMITLHREKSV